MSLVLVCSAYCTCPACHVVNSICFVSHNLQDSEGVLNFRHDAYSHYIDRPLRIAAMKAKVGVHMYRFAWVALYCFVIHFSLHMYIVVWVYECDCRNWAFLQVCLVFAVEFLTGGLSLLASMCSWRGRLSTALKSSAERPSTWLWELWPWWTWNSSLPTG